MILADPRTGSGKIYRPNLFGEADTMSAPIGEVRRTWDHGYAIYGYDSLGVVDFSQARAFIEVRPCGQGAVRIYGVDEFGLKKGLEPTGVATVERK